MMESEWMKNAIHENAAHKTAMKQKRPHVLSRYPETFYTKGLDCKCDGAFASSNDGGRHQQCLSCGARWDAPTPEEEHAQLSRDIAEYHQLANLYRI
jgi:hypothetical protein